MGDPAVHDVGTAYTVVAGVQAGLHLGQHPRSRGQAAVARSSSGLICADEVLTRRPVAVEPGDIGENDEFDRTQGDRERGGGRVGVDVVASARQYPDSRSTPPG